MPEPADSIFDAAFLPWTMGVAEEGFDAELAVEAVMLCELEAIIEGDSLTTDRVQWCQQIAQIFSGGCGLAIGLF